MQELVYLVRFLYIVPPVSAMMVGTFTIVTATAAAAVIVDPHHAAGAVVPVIVLQLFAASSGFAVPARRGHYDLLLTRGGSRLAVALAHWTMSVAPGLVSWLITAIVELVVSDGRGGALFASGTLAAVCLVSTLPWALTVPLPRFSGGIGWLLVFVTAATTVSPGVVDEWTVPSTRIDALVWPAVTFLVYPLGAVGQHLDGAQVLAVLPAMMVACCAVGGACRWIARMDVPLEAAQ